MAETERDFYSKPYEYALKYFGSDKSFGLTDKAFHDNVLKYGVNKMTEKKKRPLILKITDVLSEPMLLILLFSFAVTFGINLGKYFKTGDADFTECIGIIAAILLSVFITLIMEGSSNRAFSALNKLYDDITVKVIREGRETLVNKNDITVGDIIVIEDGDKIVADGRLIESDGLSVDESALTGESLAVEKTVETVLPSTFLAERKNTVYSGTFVTAGSGKAVVIAVGDGTEIGGIAGELKNRKETPSPLEQKLARLGKTVTLIGVLFAVLVFFVSVIKSAISGGLNFTTVQNLFVSCIVLIVAAVPEGLPTIVAVSLALNMIKLAKENALIKKMIATETAGAVSVICSDKTGTLTTGDMTLEYLCQGDRRYYPNEIKNEYILQNFICNSTVREKGNGKRKDLFGSGTEKALILAVMKNNDITSFRKKYPLLKRIPFNSKDKTMTTIVKVGGTERTLIKGAPEKILPLVNLSKGEEEKIKIGIEKEQKNAGRILCFAHDDGEGFIFDGYAVILDEIRKDAAYAVKECKNAGIKVKMLTGDNYVTAYAVAKRLKIAESESEVINASEIEKMDEQTLKKVLPRISVIARSTPIIKLRIVKALKNMGEVVAVTGDGINDAPAVKHADVGVAMGKNGSEITKEAADVILLDDSFKSIVKAVSFGRNVYKNLQRFILFQLSVNLSALAIITVCALTGTDSPFNTLGLLWINVIMDGPPALTLGFESVGDAVMKQKPVKRGENIVNRKMLLRIIFNAVFMAGTVLLQIKTNFLSVEESEKKGAVFTLFILFQLFNAFNSRKLGKESVFKGFSKNRIMIFTFTAVFLLQVLIVEAAYKVFGINPLGFITWVKLFFTASLIVAVNEAYKFAYRRKEKNTAGFKINFRAKKSAGSGYRNKKPNGA